MTHSNLTGNDGKGIPKEACILKKKIWIVSVVIAVILCCLGGITYFRYRNRDRNWYPSVAIACFAEKYEQKANVGYLTITFAETTLVVEVDDEELQAELSKADMEDVIGAEIRVTIPAEVIDEEQKLEWFEYAPRCELNLKDVSYK